ncbi:acyl dehydratase [Yinghuangia sp. ASG 101]|uniref:acyl dehydratase n=1 Tax=Yinghuangia sp. ASG 101 TaxID=2896848 RepID=UPI001E3C3F46|nr:acyl dehydratase [Yinghuangia sp. ASG 101]UGQ11438.1 acyl dehydratase [Yinghuangia sp. ASG 101]
MVTLATDGMITDEGLARLRSRIGVPQVYPAPPHYRRPNEDAFRQVARSYGDDNPLWCDPEYARGTRWKGSIAPPPLIGGDSLIGEDALTDGEIARQADLKGDPLRGVHAFYAASEREWWAPLAPDHRVGRRTALVGVVDKPSEFGGRGVQEWTAQAFRTDDGTLLGAQYRMMYRTEREKARARGKYDAIEPQVWDDEALAGIDAQYADEAPRGAEPRWWEDVRVGDRVGPLVKGPLTVTDMVCWHVGMGMGMYDVAPLRLAHRNRARIPRFYHRDGLGIPDAMQRVHWDPEFARKSGNPTTFDYGRMREAWLIHACTDWMGDDAWLWRLRVEFRKFNYVGDVQWIEGTVARRYLAEGGRPAVDLELRTRSQRDEITSPATATILLPGREHGPVRLPEPPGRATDLPEAFDAVIDGFRRDGTAPARAGDGEDRGAR